MTRDVRSISFSDETLKAVIGMNPSGALVPVTIPSGTYPGQAEDVQVFDVPLWIMACADLPEETVTEVVTRFLANIERAREVHPVVNGTTKAFVANATPSAPWHPAAQAALASAGYDSTDWAE